jgi:hypothetical protein
VRRLERRKKAFEWYRRTLIVGFWSHRAHVTAVVTQLQRVLALELVIGCVGVAEIAEGRKQHNSNSHNNRKLCASWKRNGEGIDMGQWV